MNKGNDSKQYTFNCIHCGETIEFEVDGQDFERIIKCSSCGNLSPVPKDIIKTIEKELNKQTTLENVAEYDKADFKIVGTTLVKYLGNSDEVIIPDGVTIIGKSAFEYKNIKSVKIPDSVVEIQEDAFGSCNNLINVKIGNQVSKIGEGAFRLCRSLSNIILPDSLREIGPFAFFSCGILSNIIIPDNVAKICNNAFSRCCKLESVTLGKSVIKIEECVFDYCDNLETIFWNIINDDDKFSADALFWYEGEDDEIRRIRLKNIIFGKDVKIIPCIFGSQENLNIYYRGDVEGWLNLKNNHEILKHADKFYIDNQLITDLIIPKSITTIIAGAFKNYRRLKSVTLPFTLEVIGSESFYGCNNLAEVTIPDNVMRIDESAFAVCTKLEKVTIGKNVKYIDDYAFAGCEQLTSIYWNAAQCQIGHPHKVFGNNLNLKSITLGKNVKRMPASLFPNSINVENVYYEGDLTEWCDITFDSVPPRCTQNLYINNATLPENLVIPDSVTKISAGTFGGIKELRSVSLPANLKNIEREAFVQCDNLETVYWNAINCESCDARWGNSIKTVIIDKKVISIPENAFEHCYELRYVTVPRRIAGLFNKNLKQIFRDRYQEIKFTLI